MRFYTSACVLFAIIYLTAAQLPPRLAIPGALQVSNSKPRARIQQQSYLSAAPAPRIRKPISNAVSAPIRPVVEEPEESPEQEISNFDEEVARLGISSLQSALGQTADEAEEEPPKPVQFRPERPVPLLRQDIREFRPAPVPQKQQVNSPRAAPIYRDNVANVRPQIRQEEREENVPVRRPISQQSRPVPVQQAPQQFRQTIRANVQPRQPAPQYEEDEEEPRKPPRGRKPQVQILRKYRTDNEDGSITWGFENDDGTFKEETIGIDCITRGVYGYTDPDGVKREYNYETGGTCEDPEEELLPLEPEPVVKGQGKSPKKIYRLPA